MKTVGVIGVGFVGSQVCKDLIDQGYKVVAIDNLYLPCDHIFGLLDAEYKKFEFHVADVRDRTKIARIFRKCDVCIASYGVVGAPKVEADIELSRDINVNSAKVVSEIFNSRPVINCSSGSIYGVIEDLCTEDSIPNPTSEYGIQKKEAEDIFNDMLHSVSLRFATGCGLSLKFRKSLLPNTFTYDAITNGVINMAQAESYRTFISVRDMSRALIWSAKNINNIKDKVFNCGDESLNMTKDELAKKIREKTGCKLKYEFDYVDPDSRNYKVSTERINKAGWKTIYSMDEIIEDMIQAIPLLTKHGNYE